MVKKWGDLHQIAPMGTFYAIKFLSNTISGVQCTPEIVLLRNTLYMLTEIQWRHQGRLSLGCGSNPPFQTSKRNYGVSNPLLKNSDL